jgi:O-antigen/teichoic acid export membrane protein
MIIMNLIILEKKTKVIGSIWTLAAIISLLNIILVPYFGIIAAAAVTLLSYSVSFIITLQYSRKFFEFNFDYSFIPKSILASIIMSIMIILVYPKGFLSLIIISGVSILTYILLILIMNVVNKKELEFFKELIITYRDEIKY